MTRKFCGLNTTLLDRDFRMPFVHAKRGCRGVLSFSVWLKLELLDNLLKLLWKFVCHELRKDCFQLAAVFAVATSVQSDCGVVLFDLGLGGEIGARAGFAPAVAAMMLPDRYQRSRL